VFRIGVPRSYETANPPSTTIGAGAWSYPRVLRGGGFLCVVALYAWKSNACDVTHESPSELLSLIPRKRSSSGDQVKFDRKEFLGKF